MLFCWRSREELAFGTLRERERGLLTLSPPVGQKADAVGQNLMNLYELDLHSVPCPAFGLRSSRIPAQNMALK